MTTLCEYIYIYGPLQMIEAIPLKLDLHFRHLYILEWFTPFYRSMRWPMTACPLRWLF